MDTELAAQPLRLEPVPACPVCGDPGPVAHQGLHDRLWHVPGEWTFRRCPADGVLWLSPRPVEAEWPRCYPNDYFTHAAPAPPSSGRERPARERVRRRVLASAYGYTHLSAGSRIADHFARWLALLPPIRRLATQNLGAFMVPFRRNGRLLEVGCGNGEYLLRMRDYGWEVAGIEPDQRAAQFAAGVHGLSIFPGLMEEAPYPEASFDVVACRHVLEHLAAPLPFLEGISRLLKPGGHFIAVTPNAGSLGHRLFRGDYYSLDPPRHLVLYTPAGIRELFRRIPALRLDSLRTPTRIARKIFRQGRSVRKHGSFAAAGTAATAGERLGSLLFASMETAGAVFWPLGEEIELVATRE
jgi:SAM-dependent methyltransferase